MPAVVSATERPLGGPTGASSDRLPDAKSSLAARPGTFALELDIDSDTLASCVACGMCLPHCPTYRVSGEESASPRGRIAMMREVAEHGTADAQFVEFMDACIQCRGCETACPAGVDYGHMMEATREALAAQTSYVPRLRRLAYKMLGMPRLLGAGSRLLGLAQRLGLLRAVGWLGRIPQARSGPAASMRAALRRMGVSAQATPRVPVRQRPLRPSGDDVWLFTGCVMDAWMRDTHRAAQAVIEATGAGVALPPRGAACCGSLHSHAGLGDDARRLAQRTIDAMPGDAPILVDSAGCGAAMKEYGHLLGTDEARQFAARVRDVQEWLASHIAELPAAFDGQSVDASLSPGGRESTPNDDAAVQGAGAAANDASAHDAQPARLRVVVQDPCHLRHVQQAHLPVRTVLGRYVEVVELDDEGLCCGAGGAYSQQHPETAAAVRERKVAAIERTGASLVASANPGCSLHLQAAGLDVRHPVEIIAECIAGREAGAS